MPDHEKYMTRCLELAMNGLGNVAPNPLVGCVIVYEDKIIGEGYHQRYGEAHAEVNAINSVSDQSLLKKATLYVNLEPCSHWGKTPPCADLIVQKEIPQVVIGTKDIFEEVNGRGIARLQDAGIKVETAILEKESIALNRRFFTFNMKKRPYIILKWAETADGFIAREDYSSKWISNEYSRLLVHQWRSEEAAIMVGTNTALFDNPQLSSRDMKTKNPLRIVLDHKGKLPEDLHVFDDKQPTIVFTGKAKPGKLNLDFIEMDFESPELLANILDHLYKSKIQSVIVEGGTRLLQSFIDQELWDEARVFKAEGVFFGEGIEAPVFNKIPFRNYIMDTDVLTYYFH